MSSYYIWTIGCQMNKADSESLSTALNQAGLIPTTNASHADLVCSTPALYARAPKTKSPGRWG